MSDLVLFWFSTYASVSLLALQSRNINTRRYAWAAGTSVLIGTTQLVAVRGIVHFDTLVVLGLTWTAGPLGVVSAMLFSHHLLEKRRTAP